MLQYLLMNSVDFSCRAHVSLIVFCLLRRCCSLAQNARFFKNLLNNDMTLA